MARELVHVKPAPGRLVRDPDRGMARMPEDGYPVDLARQWWGRRMRCGDVVRVPPPRPETKDETKAAVKPARKGG